MFLLFLEKKGGTATSAKKLLNYILSLESRKKCIVKFFIKAAVPPFMLGEVFFTSPTAVFVSAKVKNTFASNKKFLLKAALPLFSTSSPSVHTY